MKEIKPILVKGQRTDTKEWVCGYLIYKQMVTEVLMDGEDRGAYFIIPDRFSLIFLEAIPVIKETLCSVEDED